MALRPEFSMGHSAFNEFLWASTGIDENGAPVSVLSALARLGFDPWVEAARLTDLPKDAAIAALATLLTQLRFSDAVGTGTAGPDDITTAGRLVALLQGRARVGAIPGASGSRFGPNRFMVMMIALALAAILIGVTVYRASHAPDDRAPTFSYTAPAL